MAQCEIYSSNKCFQSLEDGTHIAEELMEKLGVNSKDLIPGAYMDLIEVKETAL
jgi:hypothetical protein